LCNETADADNLRRAFANGSSATELRKAIWLGLIPLKEWDCRLVECQNTVVEWLCANVEQLRAGAADDVFGGRSRHFGGFCINRDSPLVAELAVVILLPQRVTGGNRSDPLLMPTFLHIFIGESESKIVDRGLVLIDDILGHWQTLQFNNYNVDLSRGP
jgi:hypothetical protein